MIRHGQHVRYKEGDDKKEYYVIDYVPETKEYAAQVCIVVDYPYAPNRIKQEICWQHLDQFEVV